MQDCGEAFLRLQNWPMGFVASAIIVMHTNVRCAIADELNRHFICLLSVIRGEAACQSRY
jgi:hypothetical protein